MKKNLYILFVVIILLLIFSPSFAGEWNRKTIFDKGEDSSHYAVTNDKTPSTSTEGLFMKSWADTNNCGVSMAAWLRNDKDSISSLNEILGNISNGHVRYSYQWSERNPPLTAFSSEWTEVFYLQNKGDCDNRSLFNNKGESDVTGIIHFDFSGGPDDILDEDFGVHLTTTSENREKKTQKNPKGYLRFGEKKSSEPSWLDRPDKGKKWQAAAGDIVSYAISTDNRRHGEISDNIFFKGYGGGSVKIKLKAKAKNAYVSLFHEVSGFDLKLEQIITESTNSHSEFRKPIGFPTSLIWSKAARNSGLDFKAINKVEQFLAETGQSFEGKEELQEHNEKLLSKSIERFLKQFGNSISGENQEGGCYYIAWLLAQSAKRKAMTSQEITDTKASFESLFDNLVNISEQKAIFAIDTSNSPEIKKELNENLVYLKEQLLHYLNELSNDPLFPLFKKPIDSDIEKIIVDKLEKENILYNLLNMQIKTDPKKDFYSKWLGFYFNRVPARIIFWLVIETNKDEFCNPQYWGGMHYKAESCNSGLWPIEMYLVQIKKQRT